MKIINDSPVESVPLEKLNLHPNNPRKGNLEALGESLDVNGFYGAIVAQKSTGYILAGNHRYMAASAKKAQEIPVIWVDVDDDQAKKILLADNRTSDLAVYDEDELSMLLKSLDDLDGTGYTEEDLDALVGETSEGADDVEPTEPPEEPQSKLGEIYELGEHRLICGDCTEEETWARLLKDEKLKCIWMDPPYGVSYVGKTKKGLTIKNDSLNNDELALFLRDAFKESFNFCADGSPWYVSAPPGPRGIPFANELYSLGIFRQRLVWVKDRFVLGHSDYHYRHEDIYFGYKPGKGRMGRGGAGWFGDNSQDTLFEVTRPSANKTHPTMKPVNLIQLCLENSTKKSWIVGDPFAGSGSTLIACAQIGRVARLIELDPAYCDVIRKRWTTWAVEFGKDPGSGALYD